MDGFEIFFLQHLLPVVVLVWLGPPFLDHHLRHGSATFGIDIAQRFEITELLLILVKQSFAHVAGSNQCDFHRSAGYRSTRECSAAKCNQSGYAGDCLQKVPPANCLLFFSKIHLIPSKCPSSLCLCVL